MTIRGVDVMDRKSQLDRRELLAGCLGGALVAVAGQSRARPAPEAGKAFRSRFDRLSQDTYLNAAGATPLGDFARAGLERYIDFQRRGPGDGRRAAFDEMWGGIRGLFADLIGAREKEIALVHCTKAGEQIVFDGLAAAAPGRNIVTNDLHFNGSLHNLIGLQKAGADVRIVRHHDWDVSIERMQAAIDDKTALVAVTLVSNVNGRIENVRELAATAHAHGARLYADIIQAAGIVPLDVRALNVDFAAANGYKWLYGVHGAGFLYVKEELQGTVLPDRLFPGHLRFNYEPWVEDVDAEAAAFRYRAPQDARRYEPGHVNYLGYCAVYAGLKMLRAFGVERALEHSVALNRRLRSRIDLDRFPCITPEPDRTPINSFKVGDRETLRTRLAAERITVSLGPSYIRVSPALYNTEDDIDRLAAVLAA